MNPESESQNQKLEPRKNYTAPSLVIYGAVRDLTQGGSKGSAENNFLCSIGVFNKTRRPCSERRVKENIVRIGDHTLGFGLYLFDFRAEYRERWGNGRQFGVMIDEVETVMPQAVFMHPDGYKRVDYGILGIDRLTH